MKILLSTLGNLSEPSAERALQIKDGHSILGTKSSLSTRYKFDEIYLEVTSHCNFDCSFCPNAFMRRERGFMPFNMFTRIVDEISTYKMASKILFHVMGEPLLHPQIFDLLKYAAQKIPRQILVTNGSLFNESNIIKCFETGITNLDISYLTPTTSTFALRNAKSLLFEHYRGVVENVVRTKFLNHYKTHLRLYYPNVYLLAYQLGVSNQPPFLPSSLFSDYVHRWVIFLKNLGVNTNINLNFESIKARDIRKGFSIFLTPDFELSIKPFHYWLNTFVSVHKASIGKCSLVLFRKQLGILWNGDVVLCCGDYEGDTRFGNVRASSLREVLGGENYHKIFSSFSRGVVPRDKCKICLGASDLKTLITKEIGTYIVNFRFVKHVVDIMHRAEST